MEVQHFRPFSPPHMQEEEEEEDGGGAVKKKSDSQTLFLLSHKVGKYV